MVDLLLLFEVFLDRLLRLLHLVYLRRLVIRLRCRPNINLCGIESMVIFLIVVSCLEHFVNDATQELLGGPVVNEVPAYHDDEALETTDSPEYSKDICDLSLVTSVLLVLLNRDRCHIAVRSRVVVEALLNVVHSVEGGPALETYLEELVLDNGLALADKNIGHFRERGSDGQAYLVVDERLNWIIVI